MIIHRNDNGHSCEHGRQVPILLELVTRRRAPVRHNRPRPSTTHRSGVPRRVNPVGLEGARARGSGARAAAGAGVPKGPQARWRAPNAAAEPRRQAALRDHLTVQAVGSTVLQRARQVIFFFFLSKEFALAVKNNTFTDSLVVGKTAAA